MMMMMMIQTFIGCMFSTLEVESETQAVGRLVKMVSKKSLLNQI